MTTATNARRSTASDYLPPWLARIPSHLRALVVILVVAILLRLWPISGGAVNYDEGVYWQSLRAMAAGNPLFTSVFSSQPPFFLLGLYPFYLLFGQTFVAARLAVVVFSLAGVLGLYSIGSMLGGRWMGVVAAALLAFDPTYLAESRAIEAEVPSLTWQIACIALAVAAQRSAGRRRLAFSALSGFLLGLGVLTKLSDVVAIVPALIFIIPWDWPLQSDDVLRPLKRGWPELASFLTGAAVAVVATLAPFLAHRTAVYDQVIGLHLTAARIDDAGVGANILFVLASGAIYPLFVLSCLAVYIAIRRRSPVVLAPLLWFLATLVVLLRQQPLFDHHIALLSAPMALLAATIVPLTRQTFAGGPVHFHRISAPPLMRRELAGILALVLAVCGLLDVLSGATAALGPTSKEIMMASALESFSLPGELVASDDQYVAGLAGRSVLPELVDTSIVRIKSGSLTTAGLEALLTSTDTHVILVASERPALSARFDLLPGFRSWLQRHYAKVAVFPDGGALYLKTSPAPPIT